MSRYNAINAGVRDTFRHPPDFDFSSTGGEPSTRRLGRRAVQRVFSGKPPISRMSQSEQTYRPSKPQKEVSGAVALQVGQECLAVLELRRVEWESTGRRLLQRMRKQTEKKRFLALTRSSKKGQGVSKQRPTLALHKLSGERLLLTRSWDARDLRAVEWVSESTESKTRLTLLFNDGSCLFCAPSDLAEATRFVQVLQDSYRECYAAELQLRGQRATTDKVMSSGTMESTAREPPVTLKDITADEGAAVDVEGGARLPLDAAAASSQPVPSSASALRRRSPSPGPQDQVSDGVAVQQTVNNARQNGTDALAGILTPPLLHRTLTSFEGPALDLTAGTTSPELEPPWTLVAFDWGQLTHVEHIPEQLQDLSRLLREHTPEFGAEEKRWRRVFTALRHRPLFQAPEWTRLAALEVEIRNLRRLECELRHALTVCSLSESERRLLDSEPDDVSSLGESLAALAAKLLEWKAFAAEHRSWRAVCETADSQEQSVAKVTILLQRHLVALFAEALSAGEFAALQGPVTAERWSLWHHNCELLGQLTVGAQATLYDQCIALVGDSQPFRGIADELQRWAQELRTKLTSHCFEVQITEQLTEILNRLAAVTADRMAHLAPLLAEATPLVFEGALHQVLEAPFHNWMHDTPELRATAWLTMLLAVECLPSGAPLKPRVRAECNEAASITTAPLQRQRHSNDAAKSAALEPDAGYAALDATTTLATAATLDGPATATISATWESCLRQWRERLYRAWREALEQCSAMHSVSSDSAVSAQEWFRNAVAQLLGSCNIPRASQYIREWDEHWSTRSSAC